MRPGQTRFECALPALLSQGGYDVRAGPSGLAAEASTELLDLCPDPNPASQRGNRHISISLLRPSRLHLPEILFPFVDPLINVRGRLRPTSSNSPQPPLICNHVLASGDLLDSRLCLTKVRGG
jgi:hypothetical protein